MASTSKNIEQRGYGSGRLLREDGTFINTADFISSNTTSLNQQVTVQPTIQFAYKSVFPISTQRDSLTQTNNGTVTQQNGSEYRVRATADAGSIAELETLQKGDYIPGAIFVAGLAVRIPTQPTGTGKIEWGYVGETDGHFLRYDANGLRYVIRKNSSETIVTTLDHDPTSGYIYWFPMMYYGYAWSGVEWAERDSEGTHRMQRKATYYPDGETMFNKSNLPITIRVESDGQQLDAFVGGRHMSVEGKNDKIFRSVNAVRKNVSSISATNYVPMVSIRQNTSLDQIYIELGKVSAIADADMEFAIFRNGTLTGASWGIPTGYSSSEVATQWDVSATVISGGEKIYGDIMQGGTGTKGSFNSLDLPDKPVVDGDEWSFCLRRISGTNATATLSATARENW